MTIAYIINDDCTVREVQDAASIPEGQKAYLTRKEALWMAYHIASVWASQWVVRKNEAWTAYSDECG